MSSGKGKQKKRPSYFDSPAGVASLIFLVVGLPFLIVAVVWFYFNTFRTAPWPTVTGTVTTLRVVTSTDENGQTGNSYCPIVAFPVHGETITVETHDCAGPAAYRGGDPVELKYNPDNPQEVQLQGGVAFVNSIVFEWGFGALGLVLCGIAIAAALRAAGVIRPSR
jgi:hypothetical protein